MQGNWLGTGDFPLLWNIATGAGITLNGRNSVLSFCNKLKTRVEFHPSWHEDSPLVC